MSKESVFKEGSGSRKGFVSKFQTENNLDMPVSYTHLTLPTSDLV